MDSQIKFDKTARTVKSKELLDVFKKYNTLLMLCTKAQERAISDKTDKYLKDLGLDIIGQKKNQRENKIREYFDSIQRDLEDNTILNLVAIFEKIIFYKIPIAIDNSKKILTRHYDEHNPFSASIESFIKSTQDINKISDIQAILSNNISVTLGNKLKEIIDYRNRIAHGKRFGKETQLTIHQILEILDEVLESIAY